MLIIIFPSLLTLLLPHNSMADSSTTEIVTNYCPEEGEWRLLDDIQMYSLTEPAFDFLEAGALIDIYGERTDPECHFEVLEGISKNTGKDLARRKYTSDHKALNKYALTQSKDSKLHLKRFKVNDSLNFHVGLPGALPGRTRGLWTIKKIDGKHGLVTLSDPKDSVEMVVNYHDLRLGQIKEEISVNQELTNKNNLNAMGGDLSGNQKDFTVCREIDPEDLSTFSEISWQGEVCSTANNAKHYFDKNLNSQEDPLQYANGSKKLQLLRCIQVSMEVGSTGIYHNPSCRPGRSQRIKKYINNKPQAMSATRKPCASKKLVTNLTEQFDKAMKCLNLDPQKLFPIINHESHFQLNVMSPTGALSVGQIVRGTYNNLRKNLSKKYRTVKKANPNIEGLAPLLVQKIRGTKGGGASGDCDELMEMAKESNYKSTTQNESDRLCGPFNPEREFLLTGLNYIENKRRADRLVKSWRVPTNKKEKISHLLTTWMHNAGPYVINYHFRRFKMTYNFGRNSIANFQKEFQAYLFEDHSHSFPEDLKQQERNALSPSSGRRKEVAGFVGHVKRSLRSLNQNQLQCGTL